MAKTKILVVDDEPGVRGALQAALHVYGYDVALAEDGEAALELLEQEHFDLVFLDVFMPRMDGVKTRHHIREVAPGTPVVMITASASDEQMMDALEAPDTFFMRKPFGLTDIVGFINLALGDQATEEP